MYRVCKLGDKFIAKEIDRVASAANDIQDLVHDDCPVIIVDDLESICDLFDLEDDSLIKIVG